MFAVVDDPQRQGLDALLGAAQLRQLLLQGRFGEGRHAAACVRFLCESTDPDPLQSTRALSYFGQTRTVIKSKVV